MVFLIPESKIIVPGLTVRDFEHNYDKMGWQSRSVMKQWNAEDTAWARKKLDRHWISDDDFSKLKIAPFEINPGPDPGNQSITDGLAVMALRLFSTAAQWTPSSGAQGSHTGFVGVGVGQGSAPAELKTDHDLQGPQKSFRPCDTGYPTTGTGSLGLQLTFKGTWLDNEAIFDWNEYCTLVTNGGSALSGSAAVATIGAYKLFTARRGFGGLGTHASGNTASFTLTVTIS